MSNKLNLSIAIGAALIGSVALSPSADAANPFEMSDLSQGYMLVGDEKTEEGKCGEGKCGEGKCGEGKCGEDKSEDEDEEKGEEGKCGEGKCGEGKCGAA